MPDRVDQELAIIGPEDDIDRFCALAVTADFRRNRAPDDQPALLFSRVCPVRRPDRRACSHEPAYGLLLRFVRTSVQAHV